MSKNRLRALSPIQAREPTLGEIKRALHDLSRSASDSAPRDYAATLRQVNELVRRCARLNGIDPDVALQRRTEAVQSQRERMVGAGIPAADPSSA